ncbi:hypothetical protein GF319_00270 [Candidatus Bathyarchaeota archaeon]|nr:hypothetical protein [Candidatus Bathyarchaeota archaeon]
MSRIMEIEREIQEIKKSQDFKKINENIQILESNSGSRSIRVDSPENNEEILLRRNTDEAKEITQSYQDLRKTYIDKLKELENEKTRLKRELFG